MCFKNYTLLHSDIRSCFGFLHIALPNIEAPVDNTTTVIDERINITIPCEATGYPSPTVVWSRTNGVLRDRVSVSDSVSVPTGNGNVTRVSVNLTITSISREDTGVYICLASNYIGSDNSNVSIIVQCKFLLLSVL